MFKEISHLTVFIIDQKLGKVKKTLHYHFLRKDVLWLEYYRYESFRTGPDGGSSDKLRTSLSYSGSLNPEHLGALGPPKRDITLTSKSQERIDLVSRTVDRSDLDLRARRERSRTSSAEIDLRSTPLTAYHGDLSKTTPALSGRSRGNYSVKINCNKNFHSFFIRIFKNISRLT